jgi:hypothetical protein
MGLSKFESFIREKVKREQYRKEVFKEGVIVIKG